MATEVYSATATLSSLRGRLMGIVWSGATTAADTCVIVDLRTNKKIFNGRASGTNTYLGVMFPVPLFVGSGLQITTISSGEVILYFEDI